MPNIIYFFITCFCLICFQIKGQDLCVPQTSYIYYDNEFDFQDQSFFIHAPLPNGDIVVSPFYENDNENTYRYFSFQDKDNDPDEGWVLLSHDMGRRTVLDPNGNPRMIGVDNPYFILYNKYRSILRVFIAVREIIAPTRMAMITIHHFENVLPYTMSGILSLYKPYTNALDNLDPKAKMSVAQNFLNEDGKWLTADFPIAYDPCVCKGNNPRLAPLLITLDLVEEAEIKLKQTGTISEETIASSNNNPSVAGANSQSAFDIIDKSVKIASKGYKDGEEFKQKAQSFVDKYKWKGVPYQQEQSILTELANIANGLLPAVPYVGAAVGLFNFLTSGGEKNTSQENTSKPRVSEIYSEYTGDITSKNVFKRITLEIPGSDHTGIEDWLKPRYDEPLGVFNLIETPKISYTNYPMTQWIPSNSNEFERGQNTNCVNGKTQFKVVNPLKYVVNPSSDLVLVDLEAAVSINYPRTSEIRSLYNPENTLVSYRNLYPSTPFILSPTISQNYDIDISTDRNNSLEVELWPQDNNTEDDISIRTSFVKATCFNEMSFILNTGVIPRMYVKVKARLRKKNPLNPSEPDPNPTNKDVIILLTYRVEIIPSGLDDANRYYCTCRLNNIGGTVSFSEWAYTPMSMLGNNVPEDILLENITIDRSQELFARRKITVRDNVIIPPWVKLTLTAGEEVDIAPQLLTGFQASPTNQGELHARIGPVFNGRLCSGYDVQNFAQNKNEIYQFCSNGNKYKPIVNTKQFRVEHKTLPETLPLNLSAYPNPTTGQVWLQADSKANINASVELTDITGRVVLELQPFTLQNGISLSPLNVSSLSSGVYLLKITVNEKTTVSKLVIQKD